MANKHGAEEQYPEGSYKAIDVHDEILKILTSYILNAMGDGTPCNFRNHRDFYSHWISNNLFDSWHLGSNFTEGNEVCCYTRGNSTCILECLIQHGVVESACISTFIIKNRNMIEC